MLEAIFERHGINPLQWQKATLGNLKRALAELKEMLAGDLEMDGVSDIFGSTTVNLAKENFIRSPKLIERIKVEVEQV